MKLSPGWRSNLVVFTLIILLVGGYFLRQTRQATREIQKHAQEHSEILAAVVELNIKNTLLSRQALEETLAESLNNSARFLDYLDSVESFTAMELTAFAEESGLAGVSILGPTQGRVVSGPAHWLARPECGVTSGLRHLPRQQLYVFSYLSGMEVSESSEGGCVLVGLSSRAIDNTLENISVSRLLTKFTNLYDIAYVRFGKGEQEGNVLDDVLETQVRLGDKQLVVALKRDRFGKRQRQMRREFILFLGLLLLFGGFSSWWLYRMQHQHLKQTRDFERKMARQHEDAALGRAAATITHELKNPLNAIGMGLQRLQLEAANLDLDHQQLLLSMRSAVDRSDGILTRLRQSIHSLEVKPGEVDMNELIQQVLPLYSGQCHEQGVDITMECQVAVMVSGESTLLGELLENLLKNSVEAQGSGGFITISLGTEGDKHCILEIVNGGFSLSRKESQLLFEPYFTSKSKGTGLGLVISKRIVLAHKGTLEWYGDFEKETICFRVRLPLL